MNAAVLAAPPDTPQTTKVDCLSTYSKQNFHICTRACVIPNPRTTFSSCSLALRRSLFVCSWSVAVNSLSLPDGSFSS